MHPALRAQEVGNQPPAEGGIGRINESLEIIEFHPVRLRIFTVF